MDEIQMRLQETAQTCAKTYEDWRNNKNDSKVQESLHSAIHELRKVASRLEIELAVRERQDITSKPLPIPSHKSSTKEGKGDDDQPTHNSGGGHGGGHGGGQQKRRRPPQRPAEQGASGQ